MDLFNKFIGLFENSLIKLLLIKMSLALITEPVMNSLISIQFNNTDNLIQPKVFFGGREESI